MAWLKHGGLRWALCAFAAALMPAPSLAPLAATTEPEDDHQCGCACPKAIRI